MAAPSSKRPRTACFKEPKPELWEVFQGCVVQTPRFGELLVDLCATVVVSPQTGRIVAYYPTPSSLSDDAASAAADAAACCAAFVAAASLAGTLHCLGPREFLLPGFVDAHLHAPQHVNCGTGLDLPLMGPEGWLERWVTYTHSFFVLYILFVKASAIMSTLGPAGKRYCLPRWCALLLRCASNTQHTTPTNQKVHVSRGAVARARRVARGVRLRAVRGPHADLRHHDRALLWHS
jgi:hypothetical protein